MAKKILEVENISKLYHLGLIGTGTFQESLGRWWRRLRGQDNVGGHRSAMARDGSQAGPEPDTIWALKDVSFSVEKGEILGIVGRNGAGKSTLLKILSRVTEPTSGRAIIRGRMAALLEIGTGFHPELTGRENIYLNGTILGMRKNEIRRKFDEIVSFADIEKFIDTPVKRYSSGMYVRLAFAIAAHLEPEILLVDEVLAVGDAAFQRKCLKKMEDVSAIGRTILFVSHNMQAIQSLCHNAIQLDAGRIVNGGSATSVVAHYLSSMDEKRNEVSWEEQNAPGNDEVKLTAVRVHSEDGATKGIYSSKQDIYITLEFLAYTKNSALCVGFDLVTPEGITVLRSYQTDLPYGDWPSINIGKNRWRCTIPKGLLNGGLYYVCPKIGMHNMYWIVNMNTAVQFELILDHGVSPLWNSLDSRNRPGKIAPVLTWDSEQ